MGKDKKNKKDKSGKKLEKALKKEKKKDKKSVKEVEKVLEKELKTKTTTGKKKEPIEKKEMEFDTFRIIQADSLNWAIEPRNQKGTFDNAKRKYYPSFRAVLAGSLEMVLDIEEAHTIKSAIHKMEEFYSMLICKLKEFKLEP